MELNVIDGSGKKLRTREAADEIFGAPVHMPLLHQVVRWQRAKRRAGTHSTLTRAEMSGGGTKPWKQKGTGKARAGSNTSPLWVGGGVAHGPKPRSYEFRMNRREKRLALASALSVRNADGSLLVVGDFGLKEIGTKAAVAMLGQLNIARGAKALLVLPEGDDVLMRSFRNIAGISVLSPAGLNVYDILNHRYLIISESVLEEIEGRFQGKRRNGGES